MARKKQQPKRESAVKMQGFIAGAGEIVEQDINDTIRKNFMPYAMSVILSRAIPEIDGFKPSHRKLLYTMYKMNLLGSARTKSANIVGQTMKLNPHGDAAIYDTMVRLSRGYEALLHPYVDSKGNFGKFYSRDMAWAASRYTEARLDGICRELFRDIDKDTVDFIDNYDSTTKEPTLLPAAFPSVLVNANTGIAVGMASSICPFNLAEVCNTAIELMKNPKHDLFTTMQAPDFPGGGQIIFDRKAMEQIYETGRGSIRVRARYTFDKAANCIDITQIPPTTTIEAIVEKVIDLVKQGKLKELTDIRDETGLDGLKITIDLKRGTDPEKLMQRLFKMTSLEDSFACNFNVLIAGVPRVLGVRALFEEWTAFRVECVRRRTYFDLTKKKEKLHLLYGLRAILLDIDKAIRIVRETAEESEVVPNLMIGFGIDAVQAEYARACGDGAEVRPGAPQPDPLRRRDPRGGAGGGDPRLPGEFVLHARGLFQKDYAALAAHGRRAEAQGGRRDRAPARIDERRRAAVFLRPGAGLQDARCRFCRYEGERDGRVHPRARADGRGRDGGRDGGHFGLQRLHAVCL